MKKIAAKSLIGKRGRPPKAVSEGEFGAKSRILDTALRLFYRYGINSVGIDRIIEESEVAKMTFFKHFPSKTDLILSFLSARDEKYMNWVVSSLNDQLKSKNDKLNAIIEVMAQWFLQPDFRGCAFINTTAEVGPDKSAAKSLCLEHKKKLILFIAGVATESDIQSPLEFADQLVLIIDGATIRAQMDDPKNVLKSFRSASQRLIQSFQNEISK